MKVHYETISQALDRVLRNAEERNRRIEKIELTRWEWDELQREMPPMFHFGSNAPLPANDHMFYMGVRVEQRKP